MGGWIGRLMPRVRMGLGTALAEIINQDFVGRYELDSVNGFVDEGEGGKEGRVWRRALVMAVLIRWFVLRRSWWRGALCLQFRFSFGFYIWVFHVLFS